MSQSDSQSKDQKLIETLSVQGALLVADSTVYDASDMHKIALKVLGHEYRKMRKRYEDLVRDHREDMRTVAAEERRSIQTGEPYGTY